MRKVADVVRGGHRSLHTQKRQVVRSNPVLQRIEAVQRTTAATTPVIIGVGRKTPSNHTIQTLENTESVMIHSLHPKSPLFTTLPNINPSLLSELVQSAPLAGRIECHLTNHPDLEV